MRRGFACVLAAAGVAGCDETSVASEAGRFALVFPDLHVERKAGWEAPYRVLAGATLCPQVRCDACTQAESCPAVAVAATGPVSGDGDGCFVAEAPGEVVWRVGAPCDDADEPVDRAVMQVVAADAVEAELVRWPDRRASAGDIRTVGAGFDAAAPAPLRVVEGSQVRLDVRLYTPADGRVVAWDDGSVALTRDEGRAPVAYPGAQLELVTFAGSRATARFSAGGRTWPLGQVEGVPAAASSLALSAGILGPEGEEEPVLARAVALDADGAPLLGLPVTWSVPSGALAVVSASDLPGQDYVWLEDRCVAPEARGGPRSAVIEASHGGQSARLELTWTGKAAPADPAWTRPEECDPADGCGCRAAGGGSLLWVRAVLGLRGRAAGGGSLRAGLGLRRRAAVAAVGGLALLGGCGDGPPALTVRRTRELGALQWDPAVAGRDGGYSVQIGERSLWVFGDTGGRTPPGHHGFANNTACSTVDLDARDGLFPMDEHLDDEGYLLEFVPLTADEEAYERAHGDAATCGEACEGVALWPGPTVYDAARGRALVFYAKLYQRPGPLNITVVGTSVAVWDEPLVGVARRPEVRPGAEEPTLLFADGEFGLATAALVEGEDVLAYACDGDGFDRPCRLGRAPLADPLRREAWEFYAGDGAWSRDFTVAAELFDGAPMMTVHYNAYAQAYVATYAAIAGNAVAVRTAPAPEGPWSDSREIHHGREPVAGSTSYGALMHPELSREGGRVEYVTYFLQQTGTIELVEVEWE